MMVVFDSSSYLGKLMPELIKIREDLGVDFGAADAVDISQDAQNPPPQDEGRIGMPTSQGPTRNDADIVSQAFTTVCMFRERELGVVWVRK